MKLLREYIRELVVEQDAGIGEEQEQAAATIYYIQSYAYTMSEIFRRVLFPRDLPQPDLKNDFGEVSLDNLEMAVGNLYYALLSSEMEYVSYSMRDQKTLGELRSRNKQIGAQNARDAYNEEPINALLELIDMISIENLETGMSLEEAMRVMDVEAPGDLEPAVKKLDQLIKTDNNVIGILDALAMM